MTRVVACCVACLVVAACPPSATRFCNDVSECLKFEQCTNGACEPASEGEGAGEGEGVVGGEGEGVVGEGEGEGASVVGEGEGEGVVGEGEGAEGEGVGEGEGEGVVGEGEGEGEGEGAGGEGEGEGTTVASTCAELHAANPGAPDGIYTLTVGDVRCDMTTDGGGWALVTLFNEGDACPGAWVPSQRGCKRPDSATSGSIASAFVNAPYAWQEMRGVVHGFGFGGPDAFRDGTTASIDGAYVDGFGILVTSLPVPTGAHVFTFALGETDAFTNGGITATCPCEGGTAAPAFVGTNYLCEEPRASVDPNDTTIRFFDELDTIWDGQELDDGPVCDDAPESAPSFHVNTGASFSSGDAIELRLMFTEASANENLEIVHYDLWVR